MKIKHSHDDTIDCVVYCFKNNNRDDWAVVYGNPYLDKHPLIRVQSQCITGMQLDDNECDCKQNFEIYMRNIKHIKQEKIIENLHNGNGDVRDYKCIPKMLSIIGIKNNVKLITRNPQKEEQLIKDGLVIAEVIPYQYHITSEQNKDYLEMKKRLHIFE